jgi:outer membrane translocation and assembly module TamA
VGQVLTPKLLGQVEQWVNGRLGELGYPCPKVQAQGDPETGAIRVLIHTGPLQNLISVTEEPVPGAQQGILRRYDAFELGDRFNQNYLTVTANRITFQNLLQATYFTSTCETDGATAHQEVTAGPPRLLTFGAGIDTEGVFQLRSTWRNARIGNRASNAQLQLQLSTLQQQINAVANWYLLPYPSRRFLQPSYRLQHVNNNAYEIISSRVALGVGTTYDRGPVGAQFYLGPVLEYVRTLQGSGVGNANTVFLQLEGVARVQSHNYEYWATDPRAGYSAQLVADLASSALVSSASVQRFNLFGEGLWNYRNYDPPLWVFGLRGGLSTTLSGARPGAGSTIPASYYWYLGGSTTLRGFSLLSLPAGGAMTAIYLCPEIRLMDLPLIGVQPFFFWDLGLLGATPLDPDSPILYSPGIGLRYKSPVGVFRTTIARGFPLAAPGGWNFYFSFGEEF